MKALPERRSFYDLVMAKLANSSPGQVREPEIKYGRTPALTGGTQFGLSSLTLEVQRGISNHGLERWFFNEIKDRFEFSNAEFAVAVDRTWKGISSKAPDNMITGTTAERGLKLMELWDLGAAFFEDDLKFLQWLNTPNHLMGSTPFTMLDSHAGIQMVIDTIGRLSHGVAA